MSVASDPFSGTDIYPVGRSGPDRTGEARPGATEPTRRRPFRRRCPGRGFRGTRPVAWTVSVLSEAWSPKTRSLESSFRSTAGGGIEDLHCRPGHGRSPGGSVPVLDRHSSALSRFYLAGCAIISVQCVISETRKAQRKRGGMREHAGRVGHTVCAPGQLGCCSHPVALDDEYQRARVRTHHRAVPPSPHPFDGRAARGRARGFPGTGTVGKPFGASAPDSAIPGGGRLRIRRLGFGAGDRTGPVGPRARRHRRTDGPVRRHPAHNTGPTLPAPPAPRRPASEPTAPGALLPGRRRGRPGSPPPFAHRGGMRCVAAPKAGLYS